MALYAFDGTWNSDDEDDGQDTNVTRFCELYTGDSTNCAGVGTRFWGLGHAIGGLFGAGGRTRIREMYDTLCTNWQNGDRDIDIIGFSRGAALAVHFANKIGAEGVETSDGAHEPATVRFLGIWDLVGSFGLSFDTFINFQDINLGWNITEIGRCVTTCVHAMALDERRETFNVTRLDAEHACANVEERWFRGVHSDVGGGNGNAARSNIALQWILQHAINAGLPIDANKARKTKYALIDLDAKISENRDPKRDPRREICPGDTIDPSARPKRLEVGQDHTCRVLAALKYNWSRVRVAQGATYRVSVAAGDTWADDGVECGPDGWDSEQLPWFKDKVHQWRRPSGGATPGSASSRAF